MNIVKKKGEKRLEKERFKQGKLQKVKIKGKKK